MKPQALFNVALSLTALSLPFCQSAMAGEVNLCPADRPCFNEAYQSGDRVIFRFTGVTGWDFYNVRYPVRGGEKQVENRSGSFTFKNVQPNSVYTISVQGCNSHTFARSTCSPWSENSVTTR
ncbi:MULTISPECIES: hypothetical protein [Nostoc]|uniref:Fibronectin type III domain-containing protein n=1 Tax=Nostoc paludosum FACHB-159 TaxID=2692908 RepID=A0ABR8KEN8_9NOSO|nr:MULTISPECIES: hypothetical protein [Nostoc]MBD2680812.1 hypothetical protein [Nostoc sp. FACHB-857]MBD2736567.1 hypothetical protein [Nostoc paludosum FACHB-159]